MKRPTLTACLVIHNEEALLERCFASFAPYVDEILVVHDGPCHDASLQICKKYGAQVFERKYVGEAEPHRAWLYSKVKTDWVIQVDADEFLSPELGASLTTLIQDPTVDCYELLWPYWNGKRYLTHHWPYKKALFRIASISFLAVPHEEVRVDGRVVRTQLRLEHQPKYDNFTVPQFFSKHRKWMKIHASLMVSDLSTLPTFPKNKPLYPNYYVLSKRPLIMALPVFFYHFCGLLILGGISERWYGVRNSFMQSLYYVGLAWQIYQLKKPSRFFSHGSPDLISHKQ